MTQRCFILEGNGTAANRGCQAILRTTVEMLRGEFGPCRIVNAPAAIGESDSGIDDPQIVHLPPRPILRWQPRWVANKLRRKLLGTEPAPNYRFTRRLKQADAVLALGGDNYSLDYGRPDRFFETADLTRRAGKPFIIWGASVGSFAADREFERFAAERLRQVTLICARESESVRYLASLGVEENVVAVADPAFLLGVSRPQMTDGLETALNTPCLGLNLSGLMGRYRNSQEGWIDEAADWVRGLVAQIDIPIVLVPHVIHPRDDDHRFLAEIQHRVAAPPDRLLLVPRQFDCRQLKWVLARLHAFIGARTHATIAALSSCVPTFSIGYSLKSRGINQDIFGHTDNVLPIGELDATSFIDSALRLLCEREALRDHLSTAMPAYCERARQGARSLSQLLNNPIASPSSKTLQNR